MRRAFPAAPWAALAAGLFAASAAAQAPSAQPPDAQAPDVQPPDAQAPDAQAPDTQAPDTQAPDAPRDHEAPDDEAPAGEASDGPAAPAGADAAPDPEPQPPALPGTELPPHDDPLEKRALPDYDGLPEPGPTAGEALLWIPRALLFPLHVLTEYAIRRPIGELLTQAEKNEWQAVLYDAFTFGEGNRSGLVPTVFFDFGLQPSVGFYFFTNDAGAEGNDLRVIAGFGGVDWYRATIIDRYRPNDRVALELEGSFWERPDELFHGVGWDVDFDDRTRFKQRLFEGVMRVTVEGWRASFVRVQAGLADREFEDSTFRNEPRLSTGVEQGTFDAPTSFRNGYTAYWQRLTLAFDTRRPRPEKQHGARLLGLVEQGINVARPLEQRWVKVAGTFGAYADLSRYRTVGLNLYTGYVHALGTADVPFTELLTVGTDPLLLGGFLPGFLRDTSVLIATFEYRYPIWVLLDGSFHFSVGNVFDGYLDDFRPNRLRMSFGISFRGGDPDNSFTMMLAFGTEPFVEGPNVDSVRFVLGTSAF